MSAMVPAETTTTAVRSAAREPHHIAGFLYAGVWAVFLTVPAIAAFYSEAGLGWRILAWTATSAFAIVYLVLAWRWFTGYEEGHPPSTPHLSAGVLALMGIAALSLPGIGPWVSTYTPYLAALVIYTRSPHAGIPVGLLIWAVPSVTGVVLTDFSNLWIAAGPGIGMTFIVVMRITEYYDERDRHRSETLRQAEERDRIARDVHDVLGHSLTVLSIKAQVARRLMDSDPDRARAELDEIEQLSRDSLSQVRTTVTTLRAPQLSGELARARSTLESAGIATRIDAEIADTGSLSPLFAWALREAVTNTLRHSQASRCWIQLKPGQLRVADDGVGTSGAAEGNGLRGLRERAQCDGCRVLIGGAYPQMEGTTPQRPGTQIEVSTQ